MSIEVRRFGVGHRRPEGPAGTVGIEGQVIESRASGLVAELAFGRQARITPHSNPRTTLFLVIEGRLRMDFRDREVWLEPGEMIVVPRGVEHRPVADEEVHVLLFEPASTLNTGNRVDERTVAQLDRL